jgi:16S rRNA (cytosine1402-N4)-methyltransferase
MTMAAMTTDDVAPQFTHLPVMLDEVLAALAPRPFGVYVDATAGGAGHSAAILRSCPGARLVAFDRDPLAVRVASERLAEFGDRARVVHASFDQISKELAALGIERVDGLLADLGVSSAQLDDAGRGMSFRAAGPLDMRMDPSQGETALELIARLDQDELADVIYHLGEERRSRRVARCIKQALAAGELHDTLDLRRAVVRAVGPRRVGGVDPATRTFQALRVAVNAELEQLPSLLEQARSLLAPGGVAAIISFHSLEDRIVKRAFQDRATWRRLSSKPRTAGDDELARNPRARSAKLRAASRVEEEDVSGSEPPPSEDLE